MSSLFDTQSENISQKLQKNHLVLVSIQKSPCRFRGGKKSSFIPTIFHEKKFITDFTEKAELFNYVFIDQCSLIKKTSVLPTICENLTDKFLSNITFTDNDIRRIIKGLYPNRAHDHDMISICILKLCKGSIYKPLRLIFRACLEQVIFPLSWKSANVISIHKK